MTAALIALVVVAFFVLLVLVWAVAAFNRLVRARNQVEASWAQIDVQLKRRHSLIPNLLQTVKGYATHERATLEAVVQARNAAIAVGRQGPAVQAEAEGVLTQALGRVLALAEGYPQLRANQSFRHLQGELATTEDKIAYARQFYNSAIQTYNDKVGTFPTAVVARASGFRAEPYFEAGPGERADVDVRF